MHQLGTSLYLRPGAVGNALDGMLLGFLCCVSILVFASVAGLYHWQMHSWGKGCCGVALVIWLAIRLHTAIEYMGMVGKISDALGALFWGQLW